MDEDFDTQITRLREQVTLAQQVAARAAAARDAAAEQLHVATTKLKEDFGCDTLEEARIKLQSLQSELEKELSRVEERLKGN
jgi:hypothetical protein